MARWPEDEPRVTFADAPSDLTGPRRAKWLEEHGLALVDFLAWKRASDPAAKLRPPARRKLMTQEQVAKLDDEIEREERPLW